MGGRGMGCQGNRGSCLLCKIDGIDGAELDIPERRRPSGVCPDESTCSVGPFQVLHFGVQAELTFCDAKDEDGNLSLFRRACRIELEDGTIIERSRGRRCASQDCCTKGPLTGFTYNGLAAEAYFPNRQCIRRAPCFGNNRQNLEEVVVAVDGDSDADDADDE